MLMVRRVQRSTTLSLSVTKTSERFDSAISDLDNQNYVTLVWRTKLFKDIRGKQLRSERDSKGIDRAEVENRQTREGTENSGLDRQENGRPTNITYVTIRSLNNSDIACE
ncbi:hypothetical protein P879_01774 [Paragonimus westermani]|uniref:Uncharacterized protein n=1 Tax=Paragonimus westermani TaxID=34504 RepID=A0A8T0DU47_9TREM|nr:hypothetical protein P879_01774 [Paragonimus westermani]